MNRTIDDWQGRVDELRALGAVLLWELRVTELRYSPDQPRDAKGRFASVNSSKGVDNSENSGIIKHKDNEDYIFEDRKITEYMLRPGTEHYHEFIEVGYSEDNPQKLYDDIISTFDRTQLIDDGINKGGNPRCYQEVTLGITIKKPFIVGFETKEGNLRLVTCHRIGDD